MTSAQTAPHRDPAPRPEIDPTDSRAAIRARYGVAEAQALRDAVAQARLDAPARAAIAADAARLVARVREETAPTLMEAFLGEYGLSTAEGVGLMCLAEALLRTPDAPSVDALIRDKIEPSDWSAHLGKSSSPLVNASTWALMLTGRVLDDDPARPASALRGLVRRLGEPMVRRAVGQAMKRLGAQFVLGETIEEAMREAGARECMGYRHSYDMLGEAAQTDADARRYVKSYAQAIAAAGSAASGDLRDSPGVSVKLSALHSRYEWSHRAQVMETLVPRAAALARQAAAARIGFNVDAEEQDRLELSLDVIEALLADPALAGWDGFGVVVQAYARRAPEVIAHLHALAERHYRRLMVRLVKGAYWDAEIKRAQEAGVAEFPVFTRKAATDAAWIGCARMLLDRRDRLYPQFATHNAHSVAAVLAMAGADRAGFEFQRLHGMGESLHEIVRAAEGARCRIYAPVGAHRDLLAYLVRRLLENGANSSFVNRIRDPRVSPEAVAADPFAETEALGAAVANPAVAAPAALFAPERVNSRGAALNEPADVGPLLAARDAFAETSWRAAPMLAEGIAGDGPARAVRAPSDPGRNVGEVVEATPAQARAAVGAAVGAAVEGAAAWGATPAAERAAILRRAADLYEAHMPEFLALAAREAGKTLADGVAEVREAVDFLRYYAAGAAAAERDGDGPLGAVVCVSPWNFPLAIFTGQVAAALAAGNAVLAKPAEQTPLIAARAVELMREAGVPSAALQLLPGDGPGVGGPLCADPRIGGVCFTGSTEVARLIHRALADNAPADAALIAETGGLNAMIVDSTALPEQAVRDIVASAFRSAGQRCSALRMLYVQEEACERLLTMLFGAMDALEIGDPWALDADVGPVIDEQARADIESYIEAQAAAGRVLKRLQAPMRGLFVGPTVIEVEGIAALEREVFGPVLHVARFRARDLDRVIDAVNASGYGLTFGLHSRIDARVRRVAERLHVGNVYVNRNQIGAVVGSQPFGGEGLSGTGPKAGGPFYLRRLRRAPSQETPEAEDAQQIDATAAQAGLATLAARGSAERPDIRKALAAALAGAEGPVAEALAALDRFDPGPFEMPGPTGESNRLTLHPRGTALCLGPDARTALAQAVLALGTGCGALMIAPGAPEAAAALRAAGAPVAALDGAMAPEALATLQGFALVADAGGPERGRALRRALAARDGPILPLVRDLRSPERFVVERHLCVDTTAAGGNAALLANS